MIKTQFFCKECGNQTTKWMGRCPACGAWNSFEEEIIERAAKSSHPNIVKSKTESVPQLLDDIYAENFKRIDTGFSELNNVFGGGIVPGSLVLLGGEPGIGKSTLLLQLALKLESLKVLYVSGEESIVQLKMRADRLKNHSNKQCYLFNSTLTQDIIVQIETVKPDIVIVDSIQTMQSNLLDSPTSSISQIKECAAEFQYLAKSKGIPVFIVGHITKDGSLAGPKLLEHIVDTVLQFEGDRHYGFRLVRCVKNRFGSTSELGIFDMTNEGLKEVINPSELFISHHDEQFSGSAIAAIVEGNRPMMIETQALVSSAVYGTPQRSAVGYDTRRMNMLLAVLEKRCQFKLGTKDVFVNIAGGIQVDDTAINLAIVAAILSSTVDIQIDPKVCFAGEMGLNGEIKAVSRIEQRILEAEKLGFNKIFLSKYNLKGLNLTNTKIKISAISSVSEIFNQLFR